MTTLATTGALLPYLFTLGVRLKRAMRPEGRLLLC